MKNFFYLALFMCAFSAHSQDEYMEYDLANVCDKANVVTYGDTQPWPKDGLMKIEYRLNRDIKFIKDQPDFKGKVFIEHTINCNGQSANFNVIVPSEEYKLDNELVSLLSEIDQWSVGTSGGQPIDSWYLWKFKVKKGKLSIIGKKKYY